jgi:hypothetical protein
MQKDAYRQRDIYHWFYVSEKDTKYYNSLLEMEKEITAAHIHIHTHIYIYTYQGKQKQHSTCAMHAQMAKRRDLRWVAETKAGEGERGNERL